MAETSAEIAQSKRYHRIEIRLLMLGLSILVLLFALIYTANATELKPTVIYAVELRPDAKELIRRDRVRLSAEYLSNGSVRYVMRSYIRSDGSDNYTGGIVAEITDDNNFRVTRFSQSEVDAASKFRQTRYGVSRLNMTRTKSYQNRNNWGPGGHWRSDPERFGWNAYGAKGYVNIIHWRVHRLATKKQRAWFALNKPLMAMSTCHRWRVWGLNPPDDFGLEFLEHTQERARWQKSGSLQTWWFSRNPASTFVAPVHYPGAAFRTSELSTTSHWRNWYLWDDTAKTDLDFTMESTNITQERALVGISYTDPVGEWMAFPDVTGRRVVMATTDRRGQYKLDRNGKGFCFRYSAKYL